MGVPWMGLGLKKKIHIDACTGKWQSGNVAKHVTYSTIPKDTGHDGITYTIMFYYHTVEVVCIYWDITLIF